MNLPGADSDKGQAQLADNHRHWNVELLIESSRRGSFEVFGKLYMLVGPVDTVQREYDHYQVGNCVPEFSDEVRDFVVRLAPVDCCCPGAPVAVCTSLRRHLVNFFLL